MNRFTCDTRLYQRIKTHMADFTVQPQPYKEGKRRAAVAITVVDLQMAADVYNIPYQDEWADDAGLILTQRSAKLKKHAGQWALPGGRMDEGETAEQTALRELEEEVGLSLDVERVIGRLDDYTTRSGFTITPVVIWGGPQTSLVANPAEVESIHRIPLLEFMREDAPILEPIPESPHPVLMMPIGNSWIAAPTAAMVYQFIEVGIRGKQTRVAHYEQPYFAWR